ncbi:MAG: hypothetical protein NVSMB60_16600 [Mycobacterium sp.]
MPGTNDPAPIPEPVLQAAAATFGLLAASVRLHLLWVLAGGERDVGTLAEATGESLPTVSHHLAKLRLAGLVRARRDGKRQLYAVEDPRVTEVVELVLGQRLREHDPASALRRHATEPLDAQRH